MTTDANAHIEQLAGSGIVGVSDALIILVFSDGIRTELIWTCSTFYQIAVSGS